MTRWAVFLSLFVSTGCDEIQQISNSGFGAYEASLVAFEDGFAAAWYDTRDGNPEIYFRRISSEGMPVGPERRLTNDAAFSYEASAAAARENFAVAWYEISAGGSSVKAGVWTLDGKRLWVRSLSAAGRRGRNPVLLTIGEELFCAWIEDEESGRSSVWAGWWNFAGEQAAAPRRIAAAGSTTWNINASRDAQGRAWLAFDAKVDTRNNELFLARVDKASSNVIRVSVDDGAASKYPDIALGGGKAAMTWFDERDGNTEVYLFVGAIEGLVEGFERRAQRITATAGESIGAYAVWNQRELALAWCDNTEGQHEVYIQRFDENGKAEHLPRRLTRNRTDSLIPSLRAAADGFALAWNEYMPTPNGGHDPNARSEIVFARAR